MSYTQTNGQQSTFQRGDLQKRTMRIYARLPACSSQCRVRALSPRAGIEAGVMKCHMCFAKSVKGGQGGRCVIRELTRY